MDRSRAFDTRTFRRASAALAAIALAACGDPTDADDALLDEAPPLVGADELFDGAPDNDSLPTEGKPDAVYPGRYTDLLKHQSPVKNQGGRGVCSIFAAVALAEHLYLKAGMGSVPDFSEQYLQWSVKSQARRMADIEASTGGYNLEAMTKFGVVEEALWPYESRRWGTSDDAACTGGDKNLPTRCFTNGEPPAPAVDAPKYKLPAGRFIRTDANSLKAHMTSKRAGVLLAVKFYYQAWNHGLSKLPTSREYSRNGWVLSPNDEDMKQSPAGHAFLLVGWDDELQVQKRDKDGKGLVDAAGKPVMEKGFFMFKNSWGTGSFGVTHPAGPGYGWISYDYVRRFGTANVADAPRVAAPQEVCTDGVDNDRDEKVDCADTDCSALTICRDNLVSHSSTPAKAIPDNSTTGLADTISVTESGTVKGVSVLVDITHSNRGDLAIVLQKGTKKVTLRARDGATGRNINDVFETDAFNGTTMKGTWTLRVVDDVRGDTGRLNAWELEIAR